MTHLDVLSREPDEKTAELLATLAARHTPSSERLAYFVDATAAARSRAAKLKVVKEFESDLAEEAARVKPSQKPRVSKVRRDKLLSRLKSLATFLDKGNDGEGFTSLAELQADTKRDSTEVQTLWKRIEYRMRLIAQ